ncbi:hypothetical protein ACWERY_39520 [Streptomyces sp. NPDC004082]|jgi:hypothetical protein|uniref:hypothetical protein n=1 Tax=unclassified Streptomyces TaxID=2593676 RepID=UPI0033AE6C60
MPASPQHDSAQPVENPAGTPAAPQHHGLFLQPCYTVDLPPLDEEEEASFPPPSRPANKQRGAVRGR